jgi:hypothetical protein
LFSTPTSQKYCLPPCLPLLPSPILTEVMVKSFKLERQKIHAITEEIRWTFLEHQFFSVVHN